MHLEEAYTFDDVVLQPKYSDVTAQEVSLATQLTESISLNIPLISAAMDTVTEAPLAIAIAEEGGIGILHKNMSIETQAQQVRKVKKFVSGVVNNPITVSPDDTVRHMKNIRKQYNVSGLPVVDKKKLVGIVTSRDIRFEQNPKRPIHEVMTPGEKLITVSPDTKQDQIIELFRVHRVEKLLIVNDDFELCGMYTVKDILRAKEKPLACRNEAGQLRVGAAVGIDQTTYERIDALLAEHVDVIVVDTAHGHSLRVLNVVDDIRKLHPHAQIMAGNVVSAEGALALIEKGVHAVKVGMGLGSICTTRIVTGAGMPQVSAIMAVAAALKDTRVPIVADGGIRYSGDIAKALAAGAWTVMIGGLFAGTAEAPGDVILYQGRSYKEYRGMGSIGAMRAGSSDRYFQDKTSGKLVPEGIEGRVPYRGPLSSIIYQLTGGIRAGMGYTGAHSLEELRTQTTFRKVTNAGIRESHVHDVSITEEAPNYYKME